MAGNKKLEIDGGNNIVFKCNFCDGRRNEKRLHNNIILIMRCI